MSVPPATSPWSRRNFLATAGVTGAAAALSPALGSSTARAAPKPSAANALPPELFGMGVASGDPLPDGVVLRT
ncbi:MAG: twin-arginine translocation signal domain-containing protein, partial [Mycobacteriales bacterium]